MENTNHDDGVLWQVAGGTRECEEEPDAFDDPRCPLDEGAARPDRPPLRWTGAASSAPLTTLWAQIRASAAAVSASTTSSSEKRPLSATSGGSSEEERGVGGLDPDISDGSEVGARSAAREDEDEDDVVVIDETGGTAGLRRLSALATPQSLLGGWFQARREVSSYALTPIVDVPTPSALISPVVALAAGKYFGAEKFVVSEFPRMRRRPGSIESARVGFASPDPNNPNTKIRLNEVIRGRDERGEENGNLGYVQVVKVELSDPAEDHLVDLLRFFFEFHDPTSRDVQGRDRGYQYGSYILCGDEEQATIARAVKAELQALIDAGAVRCFGGKTVLTEVGLLGDFFSAPEDHQDFVSKNHYIGWHGLNTSNHFIRRNVWPTR